MSDLLRTTTRHVDVPQPGPRLPLRGGRIGSALYVVERLTQTSGRPAGYQVDAIADGGHGVRYGADLHADRPLEDLPAELRGLLWGPARLARERLPNYEPPAPSGPRALTVPEVDGYALHGARRFTALTQDVPTYRGLVLLHARRPVPAVVAVGTLGPQSDANRVVVGELRPLPDPIEYEHPGIGVWTPPAHLVNAALSQLDGAL